MTDVAVDRRAIRAWLDNLCSASPGYVAAVTLPGGSARFFLTTDLDRAADHVARQAETTDVYAGCCTLAAVPSTGRGGAADTLALAGLWCDLDYASPGHKWADDGRELLLPADAAEALSIVADFGLPPTAIIDSGHGFYAWWMFAEPLVLGSDDRRRAVAALSKGLGTTLVELGRRRGLHVDDVSDLARILRVPGTVNRKAVPVPVVLAEWHPERRYRPQDIETRCITRPPVPSLRRPVQTAPRLGERESPAEAFARLVSWSTVLEPAGFQWMRDHDITGYWHHPASTTGPRSISATTDAHGVPVLVVHSESAAAATGLPCGPGHRLTRFRVWALLNFGGDEGAAASAIRAMGARA